MLVLITLAVIVIIGMEVTGRIVREAKVAKTRASAEQAFYLAEAGFNKIRAEISFTGAVEAGYLDPNNQPVTESFKDENNNEIGTYKLTVTQKTVDSKPAFTILSEGVLADGSRRTVSGTVVITGAKKTVKPQGSATTVPVWVTTATFDP